MEKPEPAPSPPTPSTKGLTTKRIVLILGALAIVCAAVVAVIVLTRPAADIGEERTPLGNLVIDDNNIEQIQRDVEEKVARGMFRTYMTTTWTFPDGKSASSDAVMGNSDANAYPFWFEVTLNDTDEVVYTSSLLPVGSVMKEIILDKDLEAGTYGAILTIYMVDENNEPVESNMGFMLTLTVQQ
ncbi:MAG: hypothetical protein LBK56_07190 [Gracilibacteraceae bacterium]|jgi:hypothetical protein|nr:hypothetical protein [Gracilibacteraceae bacterium]